MTPSRARPRIVFVTRKTPFQLLIERHGTMAQARFYLQSRGQDITDYEAGHTRFETVFGRIRSSLPPDQRRTHVDRDELDRFLFAPDDIIVIVGQDGLVPNTAKYLDGQLTIGINPDPDRYDGVLCAHHPEALLEVVAWTADTSQPQFRIQRRTMAAAQREDSQQLLALNEVFVGHRTHQSARYVLKSPDAEERQYSSGVIVSTGTGATGWARSIVEQRGISESMPGPEDQALVWFVREPFPSVQTRTTQNYGRLSPGSHLELSSEMGQDGVVFADGIESDLLEFLDGHSLRIGIARQALNLVMPAPRRKP